MLVVPLEVLKQDRDVAAVSKAEGAPFVRSAQILPREMDVIGDIVREVGVDGLLADLAVGLGVEV